MVRRIAVTGGPGGGKTTLWRVLREAYPERVIAVPEVATLMFSHVFPPVQNEAERCAVQRSIFEVQRNLETVLESRLREGQWLLCDRGTPDGGGYWPESHDAFFAAVGSTHERELERYDAVLFLQTAAAGGHSIAEGNHIRLEDPETAKSIDSRLHAVWSKHPRFVHIGCEADFAQKITLAEQAFSAWLAP